MKKNLVRVLCFIFTISLGCSFASARKFPMKEVKPAQATIPAVVVPKKEVVETTIKQTVDIKAADTEEIKDETAQKTEEAVKEVKEAADNAKEEVKETAQEAAQEIKLETPATPTPAIQSTTIEKQEGTIFDLVKPMQK